MPPELLTSRRVADLAPAEVGWNRTSTEQLAPEVSVVPQAVPPGVGLRTKSAVFAPVRPSAVVMFRAVRPVLRSVTVVAAVGAAAAPNPRLPNARAGPGDSEAVVGIVTVVVVPSSLVNRSCSM